MYSDSYSNRITKKLSKLKEKEKTQYEIVDDKIKWILKNPQHRFKFLRHGKKKDNRIHIGSFVLVFEIDHKKELVYFEDYDHHDKIYTD